MVGVAGLNQRCKGIGVESTSQKEIRTYEFIEVFLEMEMNGLVYDGWDMGLAFFAGGTIFG